MEYWTYTLNMKLHVDNYVDGEHFLSSIERCLLSVLMTFNGNNSNSIVIMDNASIHHVDGVVDMISEVGALVHFLPRLCTNNVSPK